MLEQKKKPQMLLILGGLRIGDTFHIIPFLKRACQKYHVHWIHGEYAAPAVEFIRDCVSGMDISNEALPEMKSLPGGYPDVKEFALLNIQNIDTSSYDVVIPALEKIDIWFPELVCPNMVNTRFTIADVEFDRRTDALVTLRDPLPYQDHIVIQPTTISSWKRSDSLYSLQSTIFKGRTVYNVGKEGEQGMHGPQVVFKNACSFKEVAQLLVSARFAVTLHSAVACLAYHLGVPLICVSFGLNLFPFSAGRPNNIELIRPTVPVLQKVVRSYIEERREHIKEGSA